MDWTYFTQQLGYSLSLGCLHYCRFCRNWRAARLFSGVGEAGETSAHAFCADCRMDLNSLLEDLPPLGPNASVPEAPPTTVGNRKVGNRPLPSGARRGLKAYPARAK